MKFEKVGLNPENKKSELGVKKFGNNHLTNENFKTLNLKNYHSQMNDPGSLERLQVQKQNLEDRISAANETYDPRNGVQKILGLKEGQGLIMGTLDILNRPLGMVKGVVDENFNDTNNGNYAKALWNGFRGDNRDLSWTELSGTDLGSVGNFVMNLGLDIALDPLLFTPPGTFINAFKKIPGIIPGVEAFKKTKFGEILGDAKIKIFNELGNKFDFFYGGSKTLKEHAIRLQNDVNTVQKNGLDSIEHISALSKDMAAMTQPYIKEGKLNTEFITSLKRTSKDVDGKVKIESARQKMDEFLDDAGIINIDKKYKTYLKENNFGNEIDDIESWVKFVKSDQNITERAIKILWKKDSSLNTKLVGIDGIKFDKLLRENREEVLRVLSEETASYLGDKGIENLTHAFQSYFAQSARDGHRTGEVLNITMESAMNALGSTYGLMVPTNDPEKIVDLIPELIKNFNITDEATGTSKDLFATLTKDELRSSLFIKQADSLEMVAKKSEKENLIEAHNLFKTETNKKIDDIWTKHSTDGTIERFNEKEISIEKLNELINTPDDFTSDQMRFLKTVREAKISVQQNKKIVEDIKVKTTDLKDYLKDLQMSDKFSHHDLKILKDNLALHESETILKDYDSGLLWGNLEYDYSKLWELSDYEKQQFELLKGKKGNLNPDELSLLKNYQEQQNLFDNSLKYRDIVNTNSSPFKQYTSALNGVIYAENNIKIMQRLFDKSIINPSLLEVHAQNLYTKFQEIENKFNDSLEKISSAQKLIDGKNKTISQVYKGKMLFLQRDHAELTKELDTIKAHLLKEKITPTKLNNLNTIGNILNQQTGIINWNNHPEAVRLIQEYIVENIMPSDMTIKDLDYKTILAKETDKIEHIILDARDVYQRVPVKNKEIMGKNSFLSLDNKFWKKIMEDNLDIKLKDFKKAYQNSTDRFEKKLYSDISNIIKDKTNLSFQEVQKIKTRESETQILNAIKKWKKNDAGLSKINNLSSSLKSSQNKLFDTLNEIAPKLENKTLSKKINDIASLKGEKNSLDKHKKNIIDTKLKIFRNENKDVKFFGKNSSQISTLSKSLKSSETKFKSKMDVVAYDLVALDKIRPNVLGLDGEVLKHDTDALFYITPNKYYALDSLEETARVKNDLLAAGLSLEDYNRIEESMMGRIGQGANIKINRNYKNFSKINASSNKVYSEAILEKIRSYWKQKGGTEYNAALTHNNGLKNMGIPEDSISKIGGKEHFIEKFMSDKEYAFNTKSIVLPQDILKPKKFTNDEFFGSYNNLWSEISRYVEKNDINGEVIFNSVYFKNIQNTDELLNMASKFNQVKSAPNAGSIKFAAGNNNGLRGTIPTKNNVAENISDGELLNKMLGMDIYETNKIKTMAYNLGMLPEQLSFSSIVTKALETGDIRHINQAEWSVMSVKGSKQVIKKGKTYISVDKFTEKINNWRDLVAPGEHDKMYDLIKPLLEGSAQDNIFVNQVSKTFNTGQVEISIGLLDFLSKPEQQSGVMNSLFEVLGKFLKPWKAVLLFTPGYHFRNFVSNILNANVAGVGVLDYSRHYTNASTEIAAVHKMTRDIAKFSPQYSTKYNHFESVIDLENYVFEVVANKDIKKFNIWKEYNTLARDGVVGQSKVGSDFWDYTKHASKISKTKNWTKSKWNKVMNTNMFVGQYTEDISRLALYRAAVENPGLYTKLGLDSPQKFVSFSLFDYGALTEFEKNIARNFVPFYTWSRKNLEFQMKMLLMKPDKLTRVGKALNAAYGAQDINKEEMPEWIENNMWFPVKYHKDDGSEAIRFLKANPPIQDFVDLGNLKILSRLNPPLKVMFEGLTGQDMFTNKNTNFLQSSYSAFLEPFTKAIAQPFDVPIGSIPIGDNFKLGNLVGQDIEFGAKNSIWFTQDIEKLRKSYYWEEINKMTQFTNYLKKLGTSIPTLAELRKKDLARKTMVMPPIKNYKIKKNFK